MKYLIDTDWIIHALHGKEKEVKKLIELRKERRKEGKKERRKEGRVSNKRDFFS